MNDQIGCRFPLWELYTRKSVSSSLVYFSKEGTWSQLQLKDSIWTGMASGCIHSAKNSLLWLLLIERKWLKSMLTIRISAYFMMWSLVLVKVLYIPNFLLENAVFSQMIQDTLSWYLRLYVLAKTPIRLSPIFSQIMKAWVQTGNRRSKTTLCTLLI